MNQSGFSFSCSYINNKNPNFNKIALKFDRFKFNIQFYFSLLVAIYEIKGDYFDCMINISQHLENKHSIETWNYFNGFNIQDFNLKIHSIC